VVAKTAVQREPLTLGAVGAAKAPVTRAALLAGAVTDLVIDDAAAELLVD